MRGSFRDSLARLSVDHVDILYLHGPSESDLNSSVFDFFEDLKSSGAISFSGVNSFNPRVVDACARSPIDVVMLQYNFSDRRFDHSIERLVALGKTVVAGSILAQGIFDWRTFVPLDRNRAWYLLRALKNNPTFMIHGRSFTRRAQALGLDAQEAAVQFAVSHSGITSGLFGTSSVSHLLQNVQAAAQPMSQDVQRLLMRKRDRR
jgi:aryl-alcohol dehydrogenase-like predicted oxidoreductase